jgi:glutaminyl-tRNA synthetase
VENPLGDPEKNYLDFINEHSLEVLNNCYLEPDLKNFKFGDYVQFERLGYFIADPDTSAVKPVFNRTLTLRDTWAKIQKQQRREENERRAREKRAKRKNK